MLCSCRAKVWWCQAMGMGVRCKEDGIRVFWFWGMGVQVGKQHKGYEYECKHKELQTGQSSKGGLYTWCLNDDLHSCCSYFDGGV